MLKTLMQSAMTICLWVFSSGLVLADETWSFIHREIVEKRILRVEFRVYENDLDELSPKRVRDVVFCISYVLVLREFGEVVDVREKVISNKKGFLSGVNYCLSDRAPEQQPAAGIEIGRMQYDFFGVADDHYFHLIGPVDY
ncbi:MAG: hypothetical protein P1U78_10195 [Alcanivoracaceae bacterium]|nr:hypothetical protein [Alcanivoracaceae bacterium]